MKPRPLTQAAAAQLATLTLDLARERIEQGRKLEGTPEVVYMRVAAEDLAATLLGAVCGADAELELRRLLGDGRTAASFGAALRADAEHQAAHARNQRALLRLRRIRRPLGRHIDHTHPKD